VAVGTGGSIGLALIGTNLGAIPRPGDNRWWFHVPEGSPTLAKLAFYASLALLLAGWLGVGSSARGGRLSVRRSWGILACWGLPLLAGPPLFSRDIYSYIGQGQLAAHGFNPYTVAPAALGNGPLLASIAEVWRHTASPYGPLFVMVSRAAVAVSGGSLVA
jgi:alpha-1,6-mannosyltransferase